MRTLSVAALLGLLVVACAPQTSYMDARWRSFLLETVALNPPWIPPLTKNVPAYRAREVLCPLIPNGTHEKYFTITRHLDMHSIIASRENEPRNYYVNCTNTPSDLVTMTCSSGEILEVLAYHRGSDEKLYISAIHVREKRLPLSSSPGSEGALSSATYTSTPAEPSVPVLNAYSVFRGDTAGTDLYPPDENSVGLRLRCAATPNR